MDANPGDERVVLVIPRDLLAIPPTGTGHATLALTPSEAEDLAEDLDTAAARTAQPVTADPDEWRDNYLGEANP